MGHGGFEGATKRDMPRSVTVQTVETRRTRTLFALGRLNTSPRHNNPTEIA